MSIGRAALTRIGNKPIGPVGYGMLSLSVPWAPTKPSTAVEIMKHALEQGANLWNGAIFYGTPEANSLHLLRDYFKKYPEDADRVVLSLKGCINHQRQPDGRPENIRESVEEALKMLDGTKNIDVFEMARIDSNTPIETSINAMAELVKEGKIGGIGLSEVGANTIRKAHAVHPIAAVEIELSLFTPDPLKNGIMDTCHELSIPVIAYSPVGRGWLANRYQSLDDVPQNDMRRMFDRFKPDVVEQNLKFVRAVQQIAERKSLQTSQVAIAWVARQGAIPIPGSSNLDRVALNSKLEELFDQDMEDLQKAAEMFPVVGERYGGAHEKHLNG